MAEGARRHGARVTWCAGLGGPAFQAEVVRSLHALLPADAVFFATADPGTLLFTGAAAEDPLAAATARFLDNEFGPDDVNKFQSLAAGARRVASLDAATGGQRPVPRDHVAAGPGRRAARRAGHAGRVLRLSVPAPRRLAARLHPR
jgi:hypothetical protein